MKITLLAFIILMMINSCEKKYPVLTFLELDKKEIFLRVNEESKLTIKEYYPEKPKDLVIEWYSYDTISAVVFNGIVKGKAPGESYVYAKVNGVESIACKVIVNGVYDEDNDVYILGNHGKTLLYWKNGIPTQIKESKYRIIGKAIQVYNGNIYVGGDDYTGNGYPVAKYWKNGEENILSEKQSGVSDIEISSDNVYVVGYEVNQHGVFTATLWINGVATYLDDGGLFSIANAITVYNGDIYIAGYRVGYENNEVYEIAKYWKNGKETEITKNSSAVALDIFIKDNKIYTLVNENVNDLVLAKYWEDGKGFILSENNTHTIGRSMTIVDNEIYVSGYVYDRNFEHRYATLWVNGIEKRLSENTLYGETCKIASSNGDVYVLANENEEYFSGPKYWKNGKETIFIHYLDVSYANDIAVVPKDKK